MIIEVNNLTRKKVDLRLVKNLAKNIIKKVTLDFNTLSIAFVSDLEMKKLNKKYRQKDTVTDVLSFNYSDSGEIVMCYNQVQKQAKIANHSAKKELANLTIHAVLHLKGYDHEKTRTQADQMRQKEREILQYLQEKS